MVDSGCSRADPRLALGAWLVETVMPQDYSFHMGFAILNFISLEPYRSRGNSILERGQFDLSLKPEQ